MFLSIAEAKYFIATLKGSIESSAVDAVICAPFTMLKDVKEAVVGSFLKVGAQNMHFEESVAFTGEISPRSPGK